MFDDAGAAIVGATVDLLDRNTTTPVRATTTTDANGLWAISHATEGRFDVRITNGSSIRWHKYDTQSQIDTLEVANFNIRNPADTFDYSILPAAITADRILTLPLITATRTLVANNTALADNESIIFGTGADASILYDGTNLVINPLLVGSGVIDMAAGILELNNAVRFDTGVAIVAASYSVGRDADATNQLHLNVPTGATFELSVNDIAEMTLSATALNLQSNDLVTTGTIELGHATDTTLARSAAGTVQIEGVTIATASNTLTLTGKSIVATQITAGTFAAGTYSFAGSTLSDAGIVTTVDINGGTLDGAVIGGAAAAAATVTTLEATGLITATGGQIAFPATQAASAGANTLDDYEEGTFTPGIAFGGAATGVTYGSQTGGYTKVGRLVHFMVRIILTSNGSSTGAVTITGLPFAASTAEQAVVFGYLDGVSFANFPMGITNQSATTIALRETTDAGVTTDLVETNVPDTASIFFSGTYEV